MSTAPEERPATFNVRGDVEPVDSFFYTYDKGESGAPVIAGVRLGRSDVTLYSREQAQKIADAFLGLVAQFDAYASRAAEDGAR